MEKAGHMRLFIVSSLGMENGGGGEWDALRKAEEVVSHGGAVLWASESRAGSFSSSARDVCASARVRTSTIGGATQEDRNRAIESMALEYDADVMYTYGDVSFRATMAALRAAGVRGRALPTVVGVHFWTALVSLSQETGNRDVLLNAKRHRAQPWAEELLSSSTICFCSSMYLSYAIQAIMGRTVCRVVPSMPHRCSVSSVPYDPRRRFVMFGSVHPLKGGPVAVELARRHPRIPLLCLHPEGGSEEIVKQLCDVAAERRRAGDLCRIVLRDSVVPMSGAFASARVVVCAGVVDETFGRVALESAYNGVPLATSMRGNLAALAHAGSEWVDPANPRAAADAVARMYDAPPGRLRAMSREASRFAARFESTEKDAFWDMCREAMRRGRTVGLFVPWADLGLGKQGKVYCAALGRTGIDTSVFSFCTYDKERESWWRQRDQCEPTEWAHPRVYYSRNVRERVTAEEVAAFVRAFNVDVCVVPELCMGAIPLLRYCKEAGAKTISIPNIEFVRRAELAEAEKHIDIIACNNYQCFSFFASRLSTHSRTVPLSFPVDPHCVRSALAVRARPDPPPNTPSFAEEFISKKQQPHIVSMLLCCGRVGKRRKRALTVTTAFARHVRQCPSTNLRLVVTSQTAELLGDIADCPAKYMIVHTSNMRNEELAALRVACDITIIVSNEEGLGMEFFEAMEAAAILLTHNGHPHRLFAQDGVTGFVARAAEVPIAADINQDAVVLGNSVSEESMTDIFNRISQLSRADIETMRLASSEASMASFSQAEFDRRIADIVRSMREPTASANAGPATEPAR